MYFPFFEYATISRNDALGVLFTFVFCAVDCRPRRHDPALAAILLLLGQTSLHGSPWDGWGGVTSAGRRVADAV